NPISTPGCVPLTLRDALPICSGVERNMPLGLAVIAPVDGGRVMFETFRAAGVGERRDGPAGKRTALYGVYRVGAQWTDGRIGNRPAERTTELRSLTMLGGRRH